MNIYQLAALILLVLSVEGQFCRSKCNANSVAGCHSSGPAVSCNVCFSTIFMSCATLYSQFTRIEELTTANISTYWTISTVQNSIQCSYLSPWNTSYVYDFYNTLVGGDYLYRNVPITVNHYRLIIRYSIAFVGVWSANNDYIWLHMNDTLQTYDVRKNYTCALTTGATDRICTLIYPSNATNAYNGVDCLQHYTQDIYHNTSSLLLNFTYPNAERDPTIKFWNLYDILIVAYTCHTWCKTCYSNLNTQCFTCADNYYYMANNTCVSACPGGTYLLLDPSNSLTGECLTACPQGYYISGSSCLACPSGCLSCTSASTCLVSSTAQSTQQSLLEKYMILWVLLIVLGVLLLIGIVYKICFSPATVDNQELKMIPEEKPRKISYEDRQTYNDTIEPMQPYNFHIEQIDYKDNVMRDENPRVRKRIQKDMNRATSGLG